jgi:hypothetical protein
VLTGGSFGWEWESYNDALTKANYAAIDILHNPELKDMLVNVIKEHTGAKEVVFEFDTWVNNGDSYIDHQSQGTSLDAFASPETLKNWLFSPESWLYTGNDNSDSPPGFYDPPGTEYKYKLEVEGGSRVERFAKKPTVKKVKEALSRIMGEHSLCSYNSYGKDRWEFAPYVRANSLSDKIFSFGEFKNKRIIIYKLEYVYDRTGPHGEFKGYKILDTKKLTFSLTKL